MLYQNYVTTSGTRTEVISRLQRYKVDPTPQMKKTFIMEVENFIVCDKTRPLYTCLLTVNSKTIDTNHDLEVNGKSMPET